VTAPIEDIGRVADAQRRLEATIARLDDRDMRQPSLLAGWTVAHVLAHVARNADSHVRRAEAAARGEIVEQYAGGYEGRQRGIDAGAATASADLARDVHESAARLDDAWERTTRDVGGRERPLRDLPARRWQELEVHTVDLGAGVTYDDWPDDFVRTWLPRLRPTMPERLPPGTGVPALADLSEREELAWLYGRLTVARLPPLAPWG